MKVLIVNADDFGFTCDVNAGIIECHRNGILTAATLMADGAAFEDAVRLAAMNPTLDVGCHLVLLGSPGLPATVADLLRAIALGRIAIYDTLARQVQKIIRGGIVPSHLDSHKHTHLLPPVLEAVARISEEFRIPWVRRPFDFPMQAGGVGMTRRFVSGSFGLVRGRFQRVLTAHHCRMTDYFAGFQITGRYDAAELARLIAQLPEGITEFMCHPGYFTSELASTGTRLKESRQRELESLTSCEVRNALAQHGVVLRNFRNAG